jgi:hypothetical protein
MNFDIKLEHGTGILYATNLVPYEKETSNVVMEFTKLHSILGHPNNATLQETAKQMDITLVNEPQGPCKCSHGIYKVTFYIGTSQ